MKVYIVIKQDYEVSDIEGVFSKEEDADILQKYWKDIGWTSYVEEHEVK